MEAPNPKYDNELVNLCKIGLTFLGKNILPIITSLFGITYALNRMSGQFKEMSRTECVTSILLAFLAAGIAVVIMAKLNIHIVLYGFICMTAPFCAKPIADVIVMKLTPLTISVMDAAIDYVKNFVKKKDPEL